MNDAQKRAAAKKFANFWKDKGYEKGESQPFWLALLRDVFGVENPEAAISFEGRVKLAKTSFIDESSRRAKVARQGLAQADQAVGRFLSNAVSAGETLFRGASVFEAAPLDRR